MRAKKTIKKQFDFSHLRIDERLQGVHLAPFSRRCLAFGLDWLIIILCTQFLPMAVFALVMLLLVRGKVTSSVQEGNQLIDQGLQHLDSKLAGYEVEEQLRKRFGRLLSLAIRVAIVLIIALPFLIAVLMLLPLIFPEIGQQLSQQADNTNVFDSIIEDLQLVISWVGKFFGAVCYFSFFTWRWQGQTPGKRLCNIRVIKLNGTPINLYDSFERAAGYASSTAIFFMGFFQFFWDRNHQTTHDKLSETIVMHGQLPLSPVKNIMEEIRQEQER